MRSIIRRVALFAAIVAMFAIATVQIPKAYSSEFTTTDKFSNFLSGVFGLDLTKYAFELPDSIYSVYPQEFGGTVKEEVLSPKLDSNEGTVGTMSIFYNGQLWFSKIYPGHSSVIYSEQPPTDILNQTKSIIEKYLTYLNHAYSTGGSFLEPMQNILNSVSDLSPRNVTEGNVNFQVTKQGDRTRIQWIYAEGGILMDRKRVELLFENSTFVLFIDGWSLYRVSGLSMISSEEAAQIAFEAAKNFEFHLVYDIQNGPVNVKPELTYENHYVTFSMAPGRSYNGTNPSRIPRDPLTLYPQWQVLFLLNQSYGGNEGIQVGVWGDTQEIVSCNGYGSLGAIETPPSSFMPSSESPSPVSSPNQQTGSLSTALPKEYGYAIIGAVAFVAVALTAIGFRKSRPRN